MLARPRPGRSLGSTEFSDCDGSPLESPYQGELFALPDTATDDGLLLRQDGDDGIYVNEATPSTQWPPLVRAAMGYPDCERAGTFTATRGSGLGLSTWSAVDVRARITPDTNPVPSPRFLRRAIAGGTPVAVTTRCAGDRFEVSSLRFAD